LSQAEAEVADLTTEPLRLMEIAYDHADLRIAVARHPAAYPDLLDWLWTFGGPEVMAAVEARRAASPPALAPSDPPAPAAAPALVDAPALPGQGPSQGLAPVEFEAPSPAALDQTAAPAVDGAAAQAVAPSPSPPAESGLTVGEKIHNGAYIAKCVIVGGFFLVAGFAYLVSGAEGNWSGLLAIAYGIWVLSGVKSGGWRLFIY
jgi:hypothetical protein